MARCAPDRMIIEAYRPLGFVGEVYMFKNRKSCALKQVPSDIRDMMKLEIVVLHSDKTECALTRTPDTPKVDSYAQSNIRVLIITRVIFITESNGNVSGPSNG